MRPLSWPLAIHRQVINSAIESPVRDQELAAAAAAAEAEFLRLGRLSSFSSRHLSRQENGVGAETHELVPGPMGPRNQAAAAVAAAEDTAVTPGEQTNPGHVSADQKRGQEQQQQECQHPDGIRSSSSSNRLASLAAAASAGQPGSSGSPMCCCPAEGSGVLGEIDLHLLQEMDMLMVPDDVPDAEAAAGDDGFDATSMHTATATATNQ